MPTVVNNDPFINMHLVSYTYVDDTRESNELGIVINIICNQ